MLYGSQGMAKSDILEVCDSPGVSVGRNMTREAEEDPANDHTIHSGHFMVSRVHGAQLEEDDEDSQEENIVVSNPGYDFESAPKTPASSYQFGEDVSNSSDLAGRSSSRFIDCSLTKLFECMTLAYSGKITSPKWKNFKGVKLPLKDKIRLNNIIWREWHMQFIQGQKPYVCQFEPPISDKTHTKAEAIVLEGKYWKRRLESVTSEYKKWRIFFKNHAKYPNSMDRMMEEVASHAELLDRLVNSDNGRLPSSFSALLQESMDYDDFAMDFSDTLFTTLNQPFAFPNPRELGQLGNADIIQPGLIQLQPSFDEFMDTLEPLPSLSEMFGASRGHHNTIMQNDSQMMDSYNSLQSGDGLGQDLLLPVSLGSSTMMDTSSLSSQLNNSQQTMSQPMNTSMNTSTQMLSNTTVLNSSAQLLNTHQPQQLIVSSPIVSSAGILHTSTISTPQIINLVLSTDFQQQQLSQQQLLNKQAFTTMNGSNATVTLFSSPLQSLLQGSDSTSLISQQPVQSQPVPSPVQYNDPSKTKVSPSSLRHSHLSDSSLLNKKKEAEAARRASTGSVSSYKTIVPKTKEGPFVIPQAPVGLRPKGPRTLAPATQTTATQKTPLQQKNTFLAQLLTQGNNPGISEVKQESPIAMSPPPRPLMSVSSSRKQQAGSQVVTQNYTPIRPSPATSSATSTLLAQALLSSPPQILSYTNQPMAVTDFQKNMLIQAASEAMGTTTQKIVEAIHTAGIATDEWPRNSSEGMVTVDSEPTSPSTQGPLSPAYSVPSPTSDSGSVTPTKPFRPKNEHERKLYNEHRRASHITAEQKRRCNIRVGFETLHQIVPALAQNPNAKISKAATLQKTADYLAKLKNERGQMQDEQESLRKEIEGLNAAISVCQSQLPATGVPVTRQRFDQMREMFDDYVRQRTLQNWKFWIFSIIIRPLFDSYNNTVSTASTEDLCRTVLGWLDQNCSLVALRPAVLNSLRTLSISTSILSDPSRVPEQATEAVTKLRLPQQSEQSSNN